mmetsp:Transcript_27754/g.39018  ORF Transcript_27754/g.39018 Transcript_27754/m.39018 type:complete len:304 (-) Transcript_27754:171-1082(-)
MTASVSEDTTPLPATPLRICCYGSSSSKTPEKYLKEAHDVGYTLARRGHTCVNGAGAAGCMAAMNEGAEKGEGHIVGVIHEMFVVDGSDWVEKEGGANKVFQKGSEKNGLVREIIVAGGNDLQERKRLLVEGADALVVLPGGPGTWDELWEMACAKQLGLIDIPIVCVNVDGYYESFRQMLQRADDDRLIYFAPDDIVHFEPTAKDAVRWIETQCKPGMKKILKPKVKKRASYQRMESVLHSMSWLQRSLSFSFSTRQNSTTSEPDHEVKSEITSRTSSQIALSFAMGMLIGISVASQASRHR